MRISVTEAKGQLSKLVRRAEAGDEVVLTRHGHAAVPIKAAEDRRSRPALLDAARTSGAFGAKLGPTSARSRDFLDRADGLPG
jgi:prevent-host-death family protein